MNPRYRPLVVSAGVVLVVWAVVLGGFAWSRATKPTAERVARYLHETHLEALSGQARADALRRLAGLLNGLPVEERRKARMASLWQPWFEQMTDDEKVGFIDATAPSGFRQMLAAFEQMEPARRQRAMEEAVKRLREAREEIVQDEGGAGLSGTNGVPLVLTDELRERVTRIGLKAYYSESSARTKAELAPMLEELQRSMAAGRLRFHGPPAATPAEGGRP